jgi:hypothetical protein
MSIMAAKNRLATAEPIHDFAGLDRMPCASTPNDFEQQPDQYRVFNSRTPSNSPAMLRKRGPTECCTRGVNLCAQAVY